jgi:hypothetical protein
LPLRIFTNYLVLLLFFTHKSRKPRGKRGRRQTINSDDTDGYFMNITTNHNINNHLRPNNKSLFNKSLFHKNITRKNTNNRKAVNRHNQLKYQHFTQQRTQEKQLLLEAILGLLRREATKVGLEKEAVQLEHKILKRNYLQQRS